MGRDQNLCELSMNVISRFTIFVNFELCELQYFIFSWFSEWKIANYWVISQDIA